MWGTLARQRNFARHADEPVNQEENRLHARRPVAPGQAPPFRLAVEESAARPSDQALNQRRWPTVQNTRDRDDGIALVVQGPAQQLGEVGIIPACWRGLRKLD
jgi:hypothetical protein